MRRTTLFFSTLLVATGLQAQPQDQTQPLPQNGQVSEERGETMPRAKLDDAPQAVRDQIMKHGLSDELQDLQAHDSEGVTIYEARLQGARTETEMRIMEDGTVLSMRIAGFGAPMNEAAGASSALPVSPDSGSRPSQSSDTQPDGAALQSGERIDEAAGARRDNEPQAEEQAIEQTRVTQDPGETQGVPDAIRQRIQQQLGDSAVEGIQPKIFYQLNVRQNGDLQQIWADDKGTLLKPQQ